MTKEEANRMTRHHRRPKSLGGSNRPENISRIKHKHHLAWHTLFGDLCVEEIACLINSVYLDPDYFLIPKKKKKCL